MKFFGITETISFDPFPFISSFLFSLVLTSSLLYTSLTHSLSLPPSLPHPRQLGLKPKRTLRLILWTDEEAGGVGSQQYYEAHKMEAANYSILLESDEGVFTPYGMRFTGSDAAKEVSGNCY